MSHDKVDGMVIVAKLKRRLIGGAVYQDVAIRRDDGDVRRVGTILALDDIRHALVPGSRGRFYVYDLFGTKGLYGFRPIGGNAHARFPQRWAIIFAMMGLLNLMVTAGWLLLDGRLAMLPTALAIMSITLSILFVCSRSAAMRTWRADDPDVRAAALMRASGARA